MIGHAGHVEVEGTMGQAPGIACTSLRLSSRCRASSRSDDPSPPRLCDANDPLRRRYTREIMAALQRALPRHRAAAPRRYLLRDAESPGCRQAAHWPTRLELVLVVGAPSVLELATGWWRYRASAAYSSHLITRTPSEIDPSMAGRRGLRRCQRPGASTPELLVEAVVDRLRELSADGAEVDAQPKIDEGIALQAPHRATRLIGSPRADGRGGGASRCRIG